MGGWPCPQGGRAWSCATDMNFNRPVVTVSYVAPSFPDSGHTFVSCPHQDQRYRHNDLLPKNDCPNRASSSNVETAGRASLMFALSVDQANRILIVLAESAPRDVHDQPAHSALQLHNQHILRLPLSRSLQLLSPTHAKFDTGILAPKQCDTDNAT